MEEKKNKICWARVSKNVCYFVAPFLIAVLLLSIISVIYAYDVGMVKDNEDYFQTKRFAETYLHSVNNLKTEIEHISEGVDEDIKTNYLYSYGYDGWQQIESNGEELNIFYNSGSSNLLYLMIDKKRNEVYVNGEYGASYYTNMEDLKEEIMRNHIYWIYSNGKITTSIEKINEDRLKNTTFYQNNLLKSDYEIYTALQNDLPYFDTYLSDCFVYSVVKHQYDYAIYNIPIAITLLILMIPVVLIGIGKTRNQEGIYLNRFDKLPIEVTGSLILLIGGLGVGIFFGIATNITAIISIIGITIGMIVIYACCIWLLETIVKRIKTHTFIKTTLAYWFYEKVKLAFQHMKLLVRIGVICAGFALANWILFAMSESDPFMTVILFMVLYALSFMYVLKRGIWFEKTNQAIEEIYQGKTDTRLDEEEFKGEFKTAAIHINDIAGGFSNAVEEKLKSERLKTELITNVSHDIKTPLTSIINYVDLLKKEGLSEEKVAEYLAILENKAQRLKKLTEDLVEASKASSGNIKLNIERLEVNELMKQVSAEFEDKFQKRKLEEIITFTQNPVYIKADSRYMYRVLENMYSNISKYALENSRVYTDILQEGKKVTIQMKNISKEKLNITADELMQRFVRGDASRNTEGSGLGLSIARSLTELQGGEFSIYLDGDLFKIIIEFECSDGDVKP